MSYGIDRKVLKKIKNSKELKDAKTIDYDKKDRAIINVGLKNVDAFYNPASFKTYEMINSEVLHYIESYQEQLPKDEDVSLDIYVETETTNVEKKRIRETVKRHSAEEVVNLRREYNSSLVWGIVYFAIGLILLLIGMMFDGESSSSIIIYSVVIIGWVFEWVAVEMLAFERKKIKDQLIRKFQLFNAKVHVRQYSGSIKREYEMDLEE